MKIAIVHDDLVQWGGAERVLEGIAEVFPEATIFTSLFDSNNSELDKRFGSKKISTSFLQDIPGWRFLYKQLLPLYPIAFEQFNFDNYDVVLSHTTRFAKSIVTKPSTIHISYIHTPPRFLWHLSGEGSHTVLEPLLSYLRVFDRVSSQRVDTILAGSKNAARRIKKIYGCDSTVLYPYIDYDTFSAVDSFNGGYLLVVARLNNYKRIDLIIKASQELQLPLKIIGDGTEMSYLQSLVTKQSLVEFIGNVSDEMLLFMLSGCTALVIPGEEDFGLTSLESQAVGKPVIAYRSGGALETVIEGKTGLFFDHQTVEDVKACLRKLEGYSFNSRICKEHARAFSKQQFQQRLLEIVQTVAKKTG